MSQSLQKIPYFAVFKNALKCLDPDLEADGST